MARVVHFEIHADDVQRAIKFYEAVFGWTFEQWKGPFEYWLVMTGPEDEPGIDGGLAKRDASPAGDDIVAFVCTADVKDIDATVALVEANGGIVTSPKHPVPGVGWMAYFKDTEGNFFGAMQSDPQAGM